MVIFFQDSPRAGLKDIFTVNLAMPYWPFAHRKLGLLHTIHHKPETNVTLICFIFLRPKGIVYQQLSLALGRSKQTRNRLTRSKLTKNPLRKNQLRKKPLRRKLLTKNQLTRNKQIKNQVQCSRWHLSMSKCVIAKENVSCIYCLFTSHLQS